jgi:hypothetical protein
MKTAIALLAIALGAAIPMQGAAASDKAHETALTEHSQATDISAHRKRHRVHVYPGHYGYYHGYRAAYAADPSWQSPELRRLRALNRCAFDLGYGRWENCN